MKTRIRKTIDTVSLLIFAAIGFAIGFFGMKAGIPVFVNALVSFIMCAVLGIVSVALSNYIENKYSK